MIQSRRGLIVRCMIALLSVAVCSCQKQNLPSRVELVSGIRSNLAQAEVKALTPLGSYQWNIERDVERIDRSDTSEKRKWTTIRIDDYVELGVKGILILSFENDRLTSTFFYPSDMTQFLKNLAYVRGIELKSAWSQERVDGSIVGWGRNPKLGDSVFWHDASLVAESDSWLRRND